MRFEWDARKARSNFDKHSVSFELAQEIWDDPFRLTRPDFSPEGEERWWTLGRVEPYLFLVVVYTERMERDGEVLRLISARKATPRERRLYEEGSA